MRLPRDFDRAEEMVVAAVQSGVNYFDTAYIYPGNEALLGKIIARNPALRPQMNIATKLPSFLVKKTADFDKYFNTSLARLQTDHVEYYMMHILTSLKSWERLVELGVRDWIDAKKKSGEIKNVGFSYHGGADEFKRITDAYDWDFTMIQYNYYDVNNQAGKSGLLHAAQKGIPVMIMEPLRGGKLANKLPESVVRLFAEQEPAGSPARWALRWIFAHDEVLTVLSGMTSMEIVKDNIESASEENYTFTEEQWAVFDKARALIAEKTKVNCTGCGYCMPCPQGVDIPLLLNLYNDTAVEGKLSAVINYAQCVGSRSRASLCNGCGVCEKNCPQEIAIAKELNNVKKCFESGIFIPLCAIVRKIMRT